MGGAFKLYEYFNEFSFFAHILFLTLDRKFNIISPPCCEYC